MAGGNFWWYTLLPIALKRRMLPQVVYLIVRKCHWKTMMTIKWDRLSLMNADSMNNFMSVTLSCLYISRRYERTNRCVHAAHMLLVWNIYSSNLFNDIFFSIKKRKRKINYISTSLPTLYILVRRIFSIFNL